MKEYNSNLRKNARATMKKHGVMSNTIGYLIFELTTKEQENIDGGGEERSEKIIDIIAGSKVGLVVINGVPYKVLKK
jgi:hypothetical protein